jgi:hypothetical protein
LGSIVLIDSAEGAPNYSAALFEAFPSRIGHGCPAALDPVTHVNSLQDHTAFLFGAADKEVPMSETAEIRSAAQSRGLSVEEIYGLGHPQARKIDPPGYDIRHNAISTFFSAFLARK